MIDLVQALERDNSSDLLRYPAGAKTFIVAHAYLQIIEEHPTIPAMKWLWKACSQLKHKILFWLLIKNRLNTRALLHRKNFFLEDYTCVMYDNKLWRQGTISSFTALLPSYVGNISVPPSPP